MELNDDVLSIILSLLGDRVTLLTKRLRDQYFTKNGIWIHLRIKYKKGEKFIFPKIFYKYPINLDLSGLSPLTNIYPVNGYDERIIHSFYNQFTHYNPDIIEHIYRETIYIRHSRIATPVHFPQLERTDNVIFDT